MKQTKIRPIEALFIVKEWLSVEGFDVSQKQWDKLVGVLCVNIDISLKKLKEEREKVSKGLDSLFTDSKNKEDD